MYRPENWKEHIEYFNGRPKGMTDLELWEFGANSMLKALREGSKQHPSWHTKIAKTGEMGTVVFIPDYKE